jgi:hypothetical protein
MSSSKSTPRSPTMSRKAGRGRFVSPTIVRATALAPPSPRSKACCARSIANGDAGRLILRGIAPEVANPLNLESRDLATPQSSGALVLFLIAFYGLFAAVMGGMAAGARHDGRRARADVARTLLTTPVGPLGARGGQSGSQCRCSIAAAVVLTLVGVLSSRCASRRCRRSGFPFLFGLAEFGRFIVALIPLILLMPAILLYVGCRGRTFKEAQSNLSVLLFVVSLLPIVQMFLQRRSRMAHVDPRVGPVHAPLARAARRSPALARLLHRTWFRASDAPWPSLGRGTALFRAKTLLAGK